MQLSQEQVNSWKADPVTKELFRRADARIREIMEGWAKGDFATFAVSERYRGEAHGLSFLFDFEGVDSE